MQTILQSTCTITHCPLLKLTSLFRPSEKFGTHSIILGIVLFFSASLNRGKWFASRWLCWRVLSVCRPIIQFSHTLEQVPDFRIFTVCFTSQSFAFPPRRCFSDASLFVNDVLHTTPFSWLTIAYFCTYFPDFLTRPAHFNQFKQVIFTKNRTKDFTVSFWILLTRSSLISTMFWCRHLIYTIAGRLAWESRCMPYSVYCVCKTHVNIGIF